MELCRLFNLHMAGPVNRAAVWLLAIGALLRLLLAWWLPLGTDETYAIAVAREFSWSFFDHPPIGFWLPVLMAEATGIEHPVIYRLPFVAAGTVTGWAIWQLGRALGGARAGMAALLLFTLAPYMAIGGGVFVVPDGPLNMSLSLAALALVLALRDNRWRQWLVVGGWLALAMACKYQAALFPLAVLAFLVLTPGRLRHLAGPKPWVAATVGFLGLLPVVIWNIQNDWVSLTFHTGRVGPEFRPDNFARMLLGQALYLLPPILVFSLIGLWQGFRRGASGGARVLAWAALLPVALFMWLYLWGNNTFPHWTMPGWVLALPLAGDWLARRQSRAAGWWLAGFAVPLWVLLLVLFIHVPTGLLTRGAQPLPDWDNTTEIFDYSGLDAALRAAGWLEDETLIAAYDWIEAGHLSTGLGGRHDVRVVGPAPHHFQFMTAASRGDQGLLLVPGRGARLDRQLAQLAALNDVTLEPLGTINLPRAGRPYMQVHGFRIVWSPATE